MPMTGKTPYLRIRNVTKKFGGFTALRSISLDFLGSFSRASFDDGTDTGVVFRADIPTNLARHLQIEPGKWLNIRLPKEHLRVYPGGATHGDHGS
jgi:hypothetical protein